MCTSNEILDLQTENIEALLGAICAYKVLPSIASAKVVREQTKNVDSLMVALRAELVEFEKSLKPVVTKKGNNENDD